MPHWIPQAQFAGYYMALEKGFYTEMGLKVNIIHPNTSRIATESLKNKEVDVISLFLVSALTAQDKLARSLGLQGFTRWWIVEKGYLLKPLRNAFALAMSASLGSFAVIAFFGSPDFSTLPYLLYQQLGSYRTEDAAVTALVLMLFALLPFLFIEQPENRQ